MSQLRVEPAPVTVVLGNPSFEDVSATHSTGQFIKYFLMGSSLCLIVNL